MVDTCRIGKLVQPRTMCVAFAVMYYMSSGERGKSQTENKQATAERWHRDVMASGELVSLARCSA
jgi:hypothetical protein